MLKAILAVSGELQHCSLGILPPSPYHAPIINTSLNYLKFDLEHRNMIVLYDLRRVSIINFIAKEITFNTHFVTLKLQLCTL